MDKKVILRYGLYRTLLSETLPWWAIILTSYSEVGPVARWVMRRLSRTCLAWYYCFHRDIEHWFLTVSLQVWLSSYTLHTDGRRPIIQKKLSEFKTLKIDIISYCCYTFICITRGLYIYYIIGICQSAVKRFGMFMSLSFYSQLGA